MDPIQLLAARLVPDCRVTVMTGAGVSAASGVPTFRGAGGLWNNVEPETLATPGAFARDPLLVWQWYDWRRQNVAACAPNAAHHALAGWERSFAHFRLITQNVDGLHEAAGSRDVIHLHGSIWEVCCWDRCAKAPARWSDTAAPMPGLPPRCPHCGGLLRPAVVWFGEPLDREAMARAFDAADCDVFIAAGTSAVVYPAAGFLDVAKQYGAFTVEINPEATPASHAVDLVIRGGAETVLPQLNEAMRL